MLILRFCQVFLCIVIIGYLFSSKLLCIQLIDVPMHRVYNPYIDSLCL